MTSVVSFLTSKPDFHPVVIENGRSLHTSPNHANSKPSANVTPYQNSYFDYCFQ
jgi:hypothetical protein